MEVYGWKNHRTQWWFSSTLCFSTAGCMYGGLSRQVPQITQVIKQFLYDPCTHVPPWCRTRRESFKPQNGSRREFWWRQIDVMGNGYPPMWEAVSHTWMDIRNIWGAPRKWMYDSAPDTSHILWWSKGSIFSSFCISLSLSVLHNVVWKYWVYWCIHTHQSTSLRNIAQKNLGHLSGKYLNT